MLRLLQEKPQFYVDPVPHAYLRNAIADESLTLFPKIRVLRQPRINQLSLEAPLISHFESWDFLLCDQTINGEFINLQISGDLLGRQ